VHEDQGRPRRALGYYERALAIREKTHAPPEAIEEVREAIARNR
jgi:hypothetical protein